MGSGASIPEAGLTLEDARQLVPADEWVDEWDTRFAEPKVVSKRTAERVWAKKERLAPPGAVAAPARSAPTRAPEDRAIAVSAHAEEFFRMAAGFLASKKKLDAVAASMARLDAVKAVAPFAAAGAPVQTSDLNRDGAICLDDVYGAARGARGAFEALVRRVAAAAGLDEEHALLPGLKGKERCLEKVFKEYDGEFRRLCDVLRASLVAATEAQLVGVCDALLASGAVLRLGEYTPHFGDNDRLTTGNQLGIFWADKIKVHDQYSVRAIEVARNTSEIAWEMKVYGAKCSGKRYCSNPGGGWYAYSIERVYEAPIVANVQCDGTTITFDAYNTFKQMNTFPGTYTITAAVGDDDDGTVTGDFDFEAHWRAASVSVDVPFDTSSAEITITNQFGESTTAATGC